MRPFFKSVNVPILTILCEQQLPSADLLARLRSRGYRGSSFYVRMSQLRRCGYVEKKYVRTILITEQERREIEADRERRGVRPSGRKDWWVWAITELGKQALDQALTGVKS